MADTPSDRGAGAVAAALAHRDPLTGLINRQGWDMLVADAQQRVDEHGDLIAVAVIDLDELKDAKRPNAGAELIRRAADALKAVSGSGDRVVRHDEHEFAVLSNNVDVAELPGHFGIFADAMTAHGVSASMRFAAVGPDTTVVDAIAKASG